jgi:hypothetical protein
MIERLVKLIGTLLNMQLTKVSDPTNFDVIVNVPPQLSASWAETKRQMLDLRTAEPDVGERGRRPACEGDRR